MICIPLQLQMLMLCGIIQITSTAKHNLVVKKTILQTLYSLNKYIQYAPAAILCWKYNYEKKMAHSFIYVIVQRLYYPKYNPP